MNPTVTLLLEIITTAASVVAGFLKGDPQAIANAVASITEIIQKGISAVEAQTGQPIDPALIKPFQPIA